MVVLFFLSILYDNVGYCNDRGNLFAGKKVHCHQLLDTPDFRMLMLGFSCLSFQQCNAMQQKLVKLTREWSKQVRCVLNQPACGYKWFKFKCNKVSKLVRGSRYLAKLHLKI